MTKARLKRRPRRVKRKLERSREKASSDAVGAKPRVEPGGRRIFKGLLFFKGDYLRVVLSDLLLFYFVSYEERLYF